MISDLKNEMERNRQTRGRELVRKECWQDRDGK